MRPDVRSAIAEVREAAQQVDDRASTVLTLYRVGAKPVAVSYDAVQKLSEALQRSHRAQRALAEDLALDPDALGSSDPMLPPIVEGVAYDA